MWLQKAHNAMRHDFNYLRCTGLRARDNNSSFNVLHDYTSLLPAARGSSFEVNNNWRKSNNWLLKINPNAFEVESNPHLNIRLGCFFVLCLWSWKVLILRSSKDWNCRRAFPLFWKKRLSPRLSPGFTIRPILCTQNTHSGINLILMNANYLALTCARLEIIRFESASN